MRGKTLRNRARRRSIRDRKTARQIAVILDSIGVTPESSGHSWTEVLNGLRAQYTSMTVEKKRQAHVMGRLLILEKRLDVISAAIIVGPSELKRKEHSPKARRNKGKSSQKCDQCWSWGFKSIWKSREAADEFCIGEKDPGLKAYLCPHGNSWHIGHRREQKNPNAEA
jgi:hypothetical protein